MRLKRTNSFKINVSAWDKLSFISPWLLRLRGIFLITILFSFLNPLFASSTPSANTDLLLQQSRQKKLASTTKWRRLLFIPYRWYPSDVSLVDDPKFFLSGNGQNDPQAELEATIKAMLEKRIIRNKKMAHCLFPARYKFLNEQLDLEQQGVSLDQCPNLQRFLNFAKYESVSLVFSSYFINSPGSMFGHTLLRLHRNNKIKKSHLLDDSINFSAFVSVFNPVLYPFQGLFGVFPGRFALLPYYKKIQEYNNQESRDVWEYKLNLTQEEVDELSMVMVEIGEVYLDYYYLDDNCSYILLSLLEAVRPSLNLTQEYTVYTIPGDTLRSVYKIDGFVTDVSYQPSSLARYLSHYKNLSFEEQNYFSEVIDNKNPGNAKLTNCDEPCQARVFDTALEYIDYKEKISGTNRGEEYAELRTQLLGERAQIKYKNTTEIHPHSSPAHLGHNSNMVALFAGDLEGKGFADFQWQPAMHDLTSHDLGFSNEIQVKFASMTFRAYEDDLIVKEVDLLDLTSLPKHYPHVRTSAWRVNLGYEHVSICNFNPNYCKRGNITLLKGLSRYFFKEKAMTYGLAGGELIFSNVNDFHGNISPKMIWGLLIDLPAQFKFNAEARYRYPLIEDLDPEWSGEVYFTKFFNPSNEIKLVFKSIKDNNEVLLGYRLFL